MVLNIQRKLEEMILEDFHGYPRASSFIPRHSDIRKIADYIHLVAKPKVLDAGCGNGFITMLLAKEGLNIQGVNSELDEYSKIINEPKKFVIEKGNVEDGKWYRNKNVIFNSWMPSFTDWSGCFKYNKPQPQLIIYVKSRSTGLQPGMVRNYNDCDSYRIQDPFIEADRWKCFGNDDFVDERTPIVKNPIGEIIIQVRKDVYLAKIKGFQNLEKTSIFVKPYNWERELAE